MTGGYQVSDRCLSRRTAIAATAVAAASAAAPRRLWADEYADVVPLASSNEVEFLYIDTAEMGLGAEQNIVVSLTDYKTVDDASMIVRGMEALQEIELPLGTCVDGAMLFSFVPGDTDRYEVATLTFSSGGSRYLVDFTDADAAYRSFLVASPDMQMFSMDGDGVCAEPELQVYTEGDGETLNQGQSIEEGVALALGADSRARSGQSERKGDLVVALDPGHVGMAYGGGAASFGLTEQTATWKIAQACRAVLETYKGVTVVYTVTPADKLSPKTELVARVNSAVRQNADVLVSLHLNSTGTGVAHGAEVWAPYNSGYNSETHAVGVELGKNILARLEKLGLYNRGVKFKWLNGDRDYPDGSNGDYYGVIREARKHGLPAIIVEHAFLDNYGDFSKFLSDDAKLRSLGMADAQGIVNYFGLTMGEGTVYRLYYPPMLDHHYTTDANEYRVLATRGWIQEGVAWYSAKADQGKPVYRLYHPGTKDHHYTMDRNEYDTLARRGWVQENVAWYSGPNKSVPVYRLYYPATKDHHYTKDAYEYKVLGTRGWIQEGIAWYSTE